MHTECFEILLLHIGGAIVGFGPAFASGIIGVRVEKPDLQPARSLVLMDRTDDPDYARLGKRAPSPARSRALMNTRSISRYDSTDDRGVLSTSVSRSALVIARSTAIAQSVPSNVRSLPIALRQ